MYDIIIIWTKSYMISCMISWTKLWYHVWYHSLAFLALPWYWKKLWYHTWYHVFFMISYMISLKRTFSSLSCAINHMIFSMISYQYHMKTAMISRTYDIISTYHTVSPLIWRDIGLWYQELMISVPYDISYFSDIMCCPVPPPVRGKLGEWLFVVHSGWSCGIAAPNDWMVG